MPDQVNVVIGIQARSTSKRFPGKIFQPIGDKTLLDSIIDLAFKSANYINLHTKRTGINVRVAVLVPTGDEAARMCRKRRITVIEGSENDVLSRYVDMADKLEADYIVRLTADCPVLPPYVITKAVNTAIKNNYDYCSNVDPRFRTAPDGFDVEVVSRRALHWMNTNTTNTYHREHVTSILRSEEKPKEFTVGAIINYIDLEDLKLSVDTQEDLKRVQDHIRRLESKIEMAEMLLGKDAVHRF